MPASDPPTKTVPPSAAAVLRRSSDAAVAAVLRRCSDWRAAAAKSEIGTCSESKEHRTAVDNQ